MFNYQSMYIKSCTYFQPSFPSNVLQAYGIKVNFGTFSKLMSLLSIYFEIINYSQQSIQTKLYFNNIIV